MALNSAVTDTKWSPNFSAGRPAGSPDKIVIHHWGADGQTHQGVVDYLCRAHGNSSAHYVASAGRVTQLVHDYDRAWHAGRLGNPRGIGIECRPEMSDADFATVAGLIRAIRAQLGDLPLKGHRDFMNTDCPGRWYARLGALDAAARGGAAPAPAPAAATGLAVDGWIGPDSVRAWQAAVGSPYRDGVISGQYSRWKSHHARLSSIQYQGTGQSELVKRVQGIVGVTRDGFLGPQTIAAIQRRLGVTPDGYFGPETATALQRRLNTGTF
jgi:hypothetical protein